MQRRAKILIVDDERFYLNVLADLLKDDYRTVVAKNGEQALARAAEADDPPDLVLLDIMMPGMDGYEVCRRLHAAPSTRHTPVIFLTIKDEVDDELIGFELGAVDYIAKPISPAIVRARVATHVALKRSRDRLPQHLPALVDIYAAALEDRNLCTELLQQALALLRDRPASPHDPAVIEAFLVLEAAFIDAAGSTVDG